ncbi:hypothetical protein PEBR_15031 [Penicillium brasilianum]|uniref:Uncharacterized protein n=1 Tax=Penicillium brasilianum TaxID=104259 RepID=A0A1S9RQU3_PENBI|nr:hypothetical protein PEBR_15031 [Penicillium brasilianum]
MPMETATKSFRHQDYTVAWICALHLEMTAAAAMLDERHPDLLAMPNDDNSYILGRIYGHNVAIACLPAGVYGTTAATKVATQMLSTFTSIRVCLMVGIGGGVPSERNDIRLGDVVVSKPTRDFGGVIQYDHGKTVTGGRFERTGILNKPPSVLLTAVSRLQAEHELRPSRVPALLLDAVARNPRAREKFVYCGEDQDLLFDCEYDHPDPGNTCKKCDTRRLVPRPARTSHDPVIHYGLIASGNQVMKDGRSRDNQARDLDFLCFEMEAAGLMDNFPCLVIRGICDYSDSHKTKQWQRYAAATAAAYSKELLSVVHASHVADTLPAGSVTDVLYYKGAPPSMVNCPRSEIVLKESQGIEGLLERISTYDHEKIHQRLSRKRLAGTAHWFLDHPEFKAWLTEKRHSSLWCSGKIGSGKTMIATAAIERAKYEFGSPTVFFYCMNEQPTALDASSILSSFIRQLCENLQRMSRPIPEDVAREIRKFFGHNKVVADLDDLRDIFTRCFPHVSDTIYVVDGIDALDREHAKLLLEIFRSLFVDPRAHQGSRILLLSRDQVPGYINIDTFMPGIRQISTATNVMEDIKTYIDSSITDKTMCRKITDDSSLLKEIRQRLLAESSGMFLWVYLQLEILWDTCYTDAEIRFALASLPKGLEDTYGRCMERIDRKDGRVLKVLKWVSFATSPLHIEELREAIAFDLEDTAWNLEKIPRKEFVIGCCANLVVLDSTDDCVRFAHSSVKQYLEKYRERNTIQGYPTRAQGVLECGEFCVTYLSFSDFSLQLSIRRKEEAAVAVPPPILLAQESLPGLFSRRFLQKPRDQKRSVSVQFREIRTASTPDRTRYRFIDYAVKNWALQTKQIPRTSQVWEKFERLATCFNETWNFHPWISGGRSASSRLHSLFGWAVTEQHEPLLSIAQAAVPDLQRVCDLPLIGESLPALHVAAKLGNATIFEILLNICKVTEQDLEGFTALHHAASRGHLAICQLLLRAKKMKVNARSKSQCTPLWLAASNGHEEVVSLLIEKQADIMASDALIHQAPISRGAENGHKAVVKVLIEKGADLEARDKRWGQTPLLWAAENGHGAVVKVLLDKGADLEAKDEHWGRTALSWAAGNGHGAVVRVLLEKGADFEVKDMEWGRTPLSWAAENGHEAVVKVLLEEGADIEAKDKDLGQTPLSRAAGNGHEAVVRVLLEKGADFEAKDDDLGQRPLSRAAARGHEAVVRVLLEKGAYIEAKDNNFGQTPLSRAAGHGHEAVVRVLLENGAYTEAKDKDYCQTPLSEATARGHEAVVKLLLENGADVEARDKRWGQTPLLRAARNGNEAVVRVLLEKGADIEARDMESGRTSLSWAAGNGYEGVAKVLLEKGADPGLAFQVYTGDPKQHTGGKHNTHSAVEACSNIQVFNTRRQRVVS